MMSAAKHSTSKLISKRARSTLDEFRAAFEKVQVSGRVLISLPDLDECEVAVRIKEAGAIESFVYEYQPRGADADTWRDMLEAAINEANAELSKVLSKVLGFK